eukprot:scaffold48858_cov55-Attheya_sp.AAC.2
MKNCKISIPNHPAARELLAIPTKRMMETMIRVTTFPSNTKAVESPRPLGVLVCKAFSSCPNLTLVAYPPNPASLELLLEIHFEWQYLIRASITYFQGPNTKV